MPIAGYTPLAPTTVQVNLPQSQPKEYKGVVVDSKYTPLSSMIAYIAGSSWTVDYYSQIIDKDNDIKSQDIGQDGIYQQYAQIKGLELKVTSPLTASQDQATNRMAVNGTADVYPFIIPNVGDMFAADVGDGKEGVFTITSTEKKSLLKESVYTIEYTLLYYSNSDLQRRNDLITKSIQTFHYVKEFLLNGQNPKLIDEDYNVYKELSIKYKEIVRNYLAWFYSNEYKTLIVPGQLSSCYDHFVVAAILAILTTRDSPEVKDIRRLNVDDDKYLKQPQLFKALVERDLSLLQLSNPIMKLTTTRNFTDDPMLVGIVYTGIKNIVYPYNPDVSLNSDVEKSEKLPSGIDMLPVISRPGNLTNLIEENYLNYEGSVIPFIKPVLIDEYYVLSRSFYNNGSDKSVLEILTSNYINRKAITPSVLVSLIASYKNWGGLERFYYLPIIMILIKSVIRNI